MILNPDHKHLKIAWPLLLMVLIGQFFVGVNITDAGELTSRALLDCVNAIRLEHGISAPLLFNEQLHSAAGLKLADMKQFAYWRHENPVTGEKPWDFVEKAGYNYSYTGENLALGYLNSEEICSAWAASPDHLANIINGNFNEAGLAIDKANLHSAGKGILVVMMFGSRDGVAGTDNGAARMSADEKGASNETNAGEISTQLKNIFFGVIIFSYAFTFIALLSNYIANKKKKRTKFAAGMLSVFALCSVGLTMLLFIMKL